MKHERHYGGGYSASSAAFPAKTLLWRKSR